MRIGQNPAKTIEHVPQPQPVTVAVVTYIPFLSGYYAESLDVLKACLGSIWANTDRPYDLLVFDNASCPEVRAFLLEARAAGRLQYLVLAGQNMGKGGAWNFIFGAAPGEYIAYADSDIYFYPGWLSAQLKILESFPQAGMVTGMPMWSSEEFSSATVEWAQANPQVRLERGRLLAWEDYWRHSRSLGIEEERARQRFAGHENICILSGDEKLYVGAGHFQFVAPRRALQGLLPLPSDRPMGQVRSLDVALNARGYLRFATSRWWIQHMGNTRQGLEQAAALDPNREQVLEPGTGRAARAVPARQERSPVWSWKPARKFLQWVNNRSFEILYRNH